MVPSCHLYLRSNVTPSGRPSWIAKVFHPPNPPTIPYTLTRCCQIASLLSFIAFHMTFFFFNLCIVSCLFPPSCAVSPLRTQTLIVLLSAWVLMPGTPKGLIALNDYVGKCIKRLCFYEEQLVRKDGGKSGACQTRGNAFAKKWIGLLFFFISLGIPTSVVFRSGWWDMGTWSFIIPYTILFTFIFWNYS